MIHALFTFFICCGVAALPGLPPWLCFLPAAWYMGREVAQAEYRYIAAHGGKRANMPWYGGFLPIAWTAKGVCDWLLPLAVACICYCAL